MARTLRSAAQVVECIHFITKITHLFLFICYIYSRGRFKRTTSGAGLLIGRPLLRSLCCTCASAVSI